MLYQAKTQTEFKHPDLRGCNTAECGPWI